MARAKATAPRTVPVLADGSTPRSGQRVVTADGLRGVTVWTRLTVWTRPADAATAPVTAGAWVTLVRFNGHAVGRVFRTDTLTPEA